MKKITFTTIAFLIAGILTGCTSTPRTSNSNNKNKIFTGVYDESISDIYEDVFWVNSLQIGCPIHINDRKVYELRKSSDPDRNIRLQNTFNKLINSPEISGRDYFKIFGCEQFMKQLSENNPAIDFFSLEDFLNEKEIFGKNSITGKIINNTDEILRIDFFLARKNQRHFYFEIPPHEEKEFKIPRFTELRESVFEVMDHNMSILMWIGIGNPEDKIGQEEYGVDFDLSDKYTSYLFDNYSFEFTYDKDTKDYWRENFDTWKLVPRYETEENILINELSWQEVEAIFKKYK